MSVPPELSDRERNDAAVVLRAVAKVDPAPLAKGYAGRIDAIERVRLSAEGLRKAIGRLERQGLVSEGRDGIRLTELGRDVIPRPPEAAMEAWEATVSGAT